MSKNKTGPETRGLEAARPQTSKLTGLFDVSQEERRAATSAASDEGVAAVGELEGLKEGASAPIVDKVDDAVSPAEAVPATERWKPRTIVTQDTSVQPETRAETPIHLAFQMAGLVVAALGAVLVIAPHLSAGAAQWFMKHSEIRLQSGTLLISGLCVFTVSILLRALRDMRRTLDHVSSESERLEEIGAGDKLVYETLDQVRIEHQVLSREVVHLQGKLRRLTEIVANPDYTASMFRLAASVDQLGKEVDSSMKGRFGDLQLQVTAAAQHAELAEQRLASNLEKLPPLLKEHHDAQQLAVRNGVDRLQSSCDDVEALIEKNLGAAARIEAAVLGQREDNADGFANLLESSSAGARELASTLAELRTHVDRLTEQAEAVRAELAHIDGHLDRTEHTHAAHIGQLSEQVTGLFSSHAEELHEGLNTLAELSTDTSRQIKQELGGLAERLEQHSEGQAASVREAHELSLRTSLRVEAAIAGQQETVVGSIANLLESSNAGVQDLATSLVELRTSIDRSIGEHAETVRAELGHIDGRLDKHDRTQSTSIGQLSEHVTNLFSGQSEELHQGLNTLAELSTDSNRQVKQELGGLAERIDQHSEAQAASVREAHEQTVVATESAKREIAAKIAASLVELRTHVDRLIGDHAEAVRAELGQIDGRLDKSELIQAMSIEKLSGQVASLLSGHAEDLHAGLNTLAELASGNSQLVKQELGGLAERLDQHSEDQAACVRGAQEQSVIATASARNELAAKIGQLETRIEAWHAAQRGLQQEPGSQTPDSVQAARREIGESLEVLAALVEQKALDQHALVSQSAHAALAARDAADTARSELTVCLEALGAQLDRMKSEQREELHQTAQESREATDTARREWAAGLEQLETKLVQQVRDQQDLVLESSITVQQTADASKRELVAAFEQIAARLEEALATRSAELTNGVLDIAAVLETISTEVRTTLAESISPVAQPQPPVAADVVPVAVIERTVELEPTVIESPAPSQPIESSAAPEAARDAETSADKSWLIEWKEPRREKDPQVDPWSEDPA